MDRNHAATREALRLQESGEKLGLLPLKPTRVSLRRTRLWITRLLKGCGFELTSKEEQELREADLYPEYYGEG